MAKAGFWLRGAKGKLAGASMQKGANGQTIMREVVIPRNPKTNAQIYQRAIMATVMKLAAAGKILFDHSFQGFEVGQKSVREFVRLNINELRTAISNAITYIDQESAELGSNPTAVVVGPKTQGFLPFEAIISRGSYDVPASAAEGIPFPERVTDETFAQYYERNGLVPGDIYTIVFVSSNERVPVFTVRGVSAEAGGVQYGSKFSFIRLNVKPVPEGSPAASTKLSDIYEVTDSQEVQNLDTFMNYSMENGILDRRNLEMEMVRSAVTLTNYKMVVMGVIRSRVDQDLRSNTKLQWCDDAWTSGYDAVCHNGIQYPYIIPAWKQGTEQIGDSDLILEGGDQ